MRIQTLKATFVAGAVALLACCGGSSADLPPEIQDHLADYESLIEQFEPRFHAARNDPPAFRKVADTYQQETRVWLQAFATFEADLTEEQGRAIERRMEELNRRAVKMLSGT